MARRIISVCLLVSALAATGLAQTPGARDEEFARLQYESGLQFLQNKQYAEALKDFQVVIDSFPKSAVADDALLQMALYQLDVAGDLAAAGKANDRLLKDYPDTDSTPMAYVVAGRLTMAKGHTTADVDAAMASFERVPRLFPGSDAVPAAGYYAAETARQMGHSDDAIQRDGRVAMESPRSIWAARAALSEAKALAQTDRATRALTLLQHVRQQFPGTPEAATALDLNTIIYRLFVRAPAQPAYTFTGKTIGDTAKLKNVFALAFDPAGHLLVGHNKGISIFDDKGALVRTAPVEQPDAFFLDERGGTVVVKHDTFIADGRITTFDIPATGPSGKFRQLDNIPAVGVLRNGDRLVVDRDDKGIDRFSSTGKYIGIFAQVDTVSLAVSEMETVAVIDRDNKAIGIIDRDGKTISSIAAKGTGYELNNPVDLTFDSLGHLYVLDRGKPSVVVFGAKNKVLATLSIPEKDAGAFQKPLALAVDGAGRIFVFDDRADRVQVYR